MTKSVAVVTNNGHNLNPTKNMDESENACSCSEVISFSRLTKRFVIKNQG